MIVKSLVKLNKGKYKICLDNGTDFALYWAELKDYDITEGFDLTEDKYAEILNEILIPRCKKRGMHLLEKQDRSRQNLSDKLKEGGYPEEAIEAALAYIESLGYIDDSRMARSFIHFYQDSRSKRRIKQDLIAKGISPDVIDLCLEEEYENDEAELINALLEKKGYDSENATYEQRAKMFRFLMRRGFSTDSINKALRV